MKVICNKSKKECPDSCKHKKEHEIIEISSHIWCDDVVLRCCYREMEATICEKVKEVL